MNNFEIPSFEMLRTISPTQDKRLALKRFCFVRNVYPTKVPH